MADRSNFRVIQGKSEAEVNISKKSSNIQKDVFRKCEKNNNTKSYFGKTKQLDK